MSVKNNEAVESPESGAKPSSSNKFLLVWFVIPIVVVLVLAFLKN